MWRGAGILPYTVSDGEILVLLGQEFAITPHPEACAASGQPQPEPAPRKLRYRSTWSDFGGGRDPDDVDSEHTAAREFSEETVGVYGGGSDLGARVLDSTNAMRQHLLGPTDPPEAAAPTTARPVLAVVHDTYIMYCCPVRHVDSLMFQLARDENDTTQDAEPSTQPSGNCDDSIEKRCGEKRDFCWVALRTLNAAVAAGRLRVRAVDGKRITLLPRLAFALRACAPQLLAAVGVATATNAKDMACALPNRRQELIVPPPPRGRCIYLTERPTSTLPNSTDVGADHTGMCALQVLLAEACSLFGQIERAVLYQVQLSGASNFALVSYNDETDASALRDWVESCQCEADGVDGHRRKQCTRAENTSASSKTADRTLAPKEATARMVEAAKRVRAEFAFFAPPTSVRHTSSHTSTSSNTSAQVLVVPPEHLDDPTSEAIATFSADSQTSSQASACSSEFGNGGKRKRRSSGGNGSSSGRGCSDRRQNLRLSSTGRRRLLGVRRPSNAMLR